MILDEKSTGSEPDFGDWWHTGIELVVHVFRQFVVEFIFGFIHTVSGMSPPSVQEAEEEQWVNKSCVKVGSVNIEHTVPFH